jgi:hypothetical protein
LITRHVLRYFETPERGQGTLSSLEPLWIIFRKLLQDTDLGTTFYVLNGLDECDDGSLRILLAKLIDLFSPQHVQRTKGVIKLVIVSRNLSGLERFPQVKFDPDNVERVTSDLERFISVGVEELSRIEGFGE